MIQTIYEILMPFLIALILGFIAVPQLMLVSYTKDVFNMKNAKEPKSHPLSQLGGFSFFPILAIALGITLVIPFLGFIRHIPGAEILPKNISENNLRLMQVIIGSAMLYLAGLKDDMSSLSKGVKFLVLLTAVTLFPASHLWISDMHGLLGIHDIPSWIGMPMTIVFALLIVETFKLMDGLDGLASGYGILVSVLLLCISASREFGLGCIVEAATAGILIPFWIMKMTNSHWKTTMMGDSGSLVIGYLVAYMVLGCCGQAGGRLPISSYVLVFTSFMLPILEISRVVMSRLRDHRGWRTPDRNQINHKLLRMGMRRWQIVTSLIVINGLFYVINAMPIFTDVSMTSIFILDICYWIVLHIIINRFIYDRERRYFQHEWNKVYGKEAWTATLEQQNINITSGGRKQIYEQDDNVSAHTVARWASSSKETEYIPDGMSSFGRNTKRLTDLFIASFCLIIFSPLFLITYILVRREDGGPAIYKQERIGRFGRPFYIYKFRSMRMDAEKFGPALYNATEGDDPRLTKIGKFIRAHHLDELPQIWNVFKGDMAFVGYRPERQFYIDQIVEQDPRYVFLYQIRPGVTSYATLYNGYTDTIEKMVKRLGYDLYYLQHRSWLFDMKILWNTFSSIAFGKKF